jgi:N-acetylmuramoyl-L-alanine amidase
MNWTYIINHHTGAEEKNAAQVKNYHVNTLGWKDVGYNYLIERDGKIVTGRSLNVAGAHCKVAGMNSKGIGIAIIGNLENRKPTNEQYNSLIELNAKLCKNHNISVGNILGHKEVKGAATVCPGKNLNMNNVRVAVREKMNQQNSSIIAKKYKVMKTVSGYYNSYDAKNRKNKKTEVKAGDYYIYNTFQGMINVTTKVGVPGCWINPADNVVVEKSEMLYKVQCGVFSNEQNAKKRVQELKKVGFDAFYYKV